MRRVRRRIELTWLASDPGSHAVAAAQASRDPVKPDHPIQRAGRDLELLKEVMQMPPQPPLLIRVLCNKVVVIVEQQPDLQAAGLQVSGRERVNVLA